MLFQVKAKHHIAQKFRETFIRWVVSNIFYFHPYLGKISNLTSIFSRWVETTNQFMKVLFPRKMH